MGAKERILDHCMFLSSFPTSPVYGNVSLHVRSWSFCMKSVSFTVQSSTDGLSSLVDQDASVVVKLDDATVGSLELLLCANDDCVSDISTADLVGSADRNTTSSCFRAEVPLLLYDYNDTITCMRQVRIMRRGHLVVRYNGSM